MLCVDTTSLVLVMKEAIPMLNLDTVIIYLTSRLRSALTDLPNVIKYSFLERGSDERQYCAPGIDLPLSTFCRSKFGKYPEYHSSRDDFSVVTDKGLAGSFDVIKTIIDCFEFGLFPQVKVLGEPQLGKEGCTQIHQCLQRYSSSGVANEYYRVLRWQESIFQIAQRLNINVKLVLEELKILEAHDLITLST